RTRFRRQVLGKQPPPRSQGHKEKDVLAKKPPQHQAGGEQHGALDPAQGSRGLPAVECPNRNQIQDVEPCSRSSKRCPSPIAGLQVDQGTNSRRDPSRERTRKTYSRSCLTTYAPALPAHIRSQAPQKHRHIRRQA